MHSKSDTLAPGGAWSARADSAPRWRTGCAQAGQPVEGPARRGEVPRRCRAIVLCVPDAEIPAAAATVAGAAPLVGHTSGATPLSALAAATDAGAEAFGRHPLQTFAAATPPRRRSGRRCAGAGSTPAALAFAARARRDARHDPLRHSTTSTAPPTTRPPRSPPTSSSRCRPPPSGSPPAPASSRTRPAQLLAPLSAARSRTTPRTGPSARSPAPSRAATRRRSRASARPSSTPRRSCCRCSTSWSTAPAAWPDARRSREDGPQRRRAARAARRPSAAPAAASGWCRRWASSTTATCR